MNCRERCSVRDVCKQWYPDSQGEEGLDESDCPRAWRIEDELSEEIPFMEPYDGPEEGDF